MNYPNNDHLNGIYNNLAENLRALRKMSRLSQESVSEILHTSRQHHGDCENGTAIPSLVTLCILADVYQVQIDAMITKNITQEILSMMRQPTGLPPGLGK